MEAGMTALNGDLRYTNEVKNNPDLQILSPDRKKDK